MNYIRALESFEKYFYWTALDRRNWNAPAAAADIGMTRQGVYNIIRRYRLKPESRPPGPSAFLVPEGIKQKPVRRVVLFDSLDFAWLKSKGHIGSLSQLVRAGLRGLKKMPESRIRGLL